MQASDMESLTRTIQIKEDLIKVREHALLGQLLLQRLQRNPFFPICPSTSLCSLNGKISGTKLQACCGSCVWVPLLKQGVSSEHRGYLFGDGIASGLPASLLLGPEGKDPKPQEGRYLASCSSCTKNPSSRALQTERAVSLLSSCPRQLSVFNSHWVHWYFLDLGLH